MLKYIGNGSFVVGVPARDLTTQEAKKFGVDRLLGTGLYIEPEQKPHKKKSEKESLTEGVEHGDWN